MNIGNIGATTYNSLTRRCAEPKTANAGNGNFMATVGKGHTVYMMTPERIYSGGNGTGLSFYIEYAKETSEDNPTVIAKGVDENGQEFEQTIHINDINPKNASLVEMRAVEAHYQINKGMGLSSLPNGTGNMGLNDRRDFISLFEKSIEDMQRLGRYDLSLVYAKNKNAYLDLVEKNRENEIPIDFSRFAPNAPEEVRRAFMEASEETGYKEYTGNEMMNHISQILVTQVENRYNGVPNPKDVFGSSVASALRAAKQMLYDLENPLVPISQRGENVAKYEEQEKEFYRKFIEKLETIA